MRATTTTKPKTRGDKVNAEQLADLALVNDIPLFLMDDEPSFTLDQQLAFQRLTEALPSLLTDLAAAEAERDLLLRDQPAGVKHFRCRALDAEARVEALAKAVTHVIASSPGTPDSVKTFLSRALSPLTPVPEQERNGE